MTHKTDLWQCGCCQRYFGTKPSPCARCGGDDPHEHRSYSNRRQPFGNARKLWACLTCETFLKPREQGVRHTTRPDECPTCKEESHLHYFPSLAEATRWRQLCHLRDIGVIADLTLQPAFPIHGSDGSVIFTVYADFRYRFTADDREVIEDAKSPGLKTITRDHRRNVKAVRAEYGIDIEAVVIEARTSRRNGGAAGAVTVTPAKARGIRSRGTQRRLG